MARALWSVLLFVCLVFAARGARADEHFEQVKRRGTIVWGGDEEGGAPYVFPRDDDPSRVTGFEVEIAERIGAYLKVKPEFAQGDWDKMPDLLKAEKVDVILNGYEWTPLRAELMDSSIPYYVY